MTTDPRDVIAAAINANHQDGTYIDVYLVVDAILALPTVRMWRERSEAIDAAFVHMNGAWVVGVEGDVDSLSTDAPHLLARLRAVGTESEQP